MLLGLTSFLIIRMWFGKAVEDFNNAVEQQGDKAPQLIAEVSNGFISEFICYFPASIFSQSFISGMGRIRIPRDPARLCPG